jgi:regulator of sigma E protease
MHQLVALLSTAASFIVIISAIVFVHEFGHYLLAKWAGVKVEVFSLGFGHEIWGFSDRSGTRWRLAAWPLGGYVKMYGDASEASTPLESISSLSEEDKSKTFYYKPLYKKAAVVVAGPLANFLLTILIITLFIVLHGLASTDPVIGSVIKNTPAQAAGLKEGDRVLKVDGDEVDSFSDISRLLLTNLGTPVTLQILRANQPIQLAITPTQITEKDGYGNDYTHPIIGIKSREIKLEDVGPVRAVQEAVRMTYHICTTTLKAIGQMIMGQRGAKDIKGPLGIAKLSGQAADKGLTTVFWFMAMLSANLGLINLFPVPMLDGGHLFYYAIEAIQGRPLAKRFQEYGFRLGMAMIAMLMAFAIFNDIKNLLLSV